MPAAACSPTAAAVINDTTATGPTASTRLLPNTAYNSKGATLAYSPTSGGSPAVYFQNQITTSSKGTIGANDYEVSPEKTSAVPGRRDAQDQLVSIQFRKGLVLPRALIHALVFNCESAGVQVWKLRRLRVSNVEISKLRNQAPPQTVADDWEIGTLEFARRKPAAQR